jgi:IS6 family transposase
VPSTSHDRVSRCSCAIGGPRGGFGGPRRKATAPQLRHEWISTLQRFDAVNPSKTGQISRASRNEFIDAARPARHATGDRWFIDETYVKVAGRWIYLYRAVDQRGQVIDVLVSTRRDTTAARAFFARALRCATAPVEVTTDRAPVYPRVVDELVPRARHVVEQYANNIVEADHGRLKSRLRPMRGLKRLASARTIAAGHAFVQNLRRGHYDIVADEPLVNRVRLAFDEFASCL